MKLVRYARAGRAAPGLVDDEGRVRDLSAHIADITPEALSPAALARLRKLDHDALPEAGDCALLAPIAGARKFLAIGLNYADHAAESNLPIPAEPVLFSKAITCLGGPFDDIVLPREATKVDWEVELGVVIGARAQYVGAGEALAHVAGLLVVHDVSERAFQKERGGTWDKGKGCDTFGPIGPWLVTPDEIEDCQNLDMFLELNGRRMQSGNTGTMIFPVAECIAYVSRFITLFPGDLLITGTPPGVGEGQKPNAIFLKPGDEMRLGVTGLGEQKQICVPFSLELEA